MGEIMRRWKAREISKNQFINMISLVFEVMFWKCFISRYHVDISRAFLRGKTITEQKIFLEVLLLAIE